MADRYVMRIRPPADDSEANWDLDEHLPAGGGWTTETNNPWSSLTPGGGWTETTEKSGGPHTLITDATEDPTGGNSCVRQPWGGVPDGFSPQFFYFGLGAQNEVFGSEVLAMEAGWDRPSNEIKYLFSNGNSGGWWMLAFFGEDGVYGSGPDESMVCRLLRRTTSTPNDMLSRIDLHAATTPVPVGEPFKLSWHGVLAPARLTCWLGSARLFDTNDGVVLADGSTPAAFSWGAIVDPFAEKQFGAVWGGGNDVTPAPAENATRHYAAKLQTR